MIANPSRRWLLAAGPLAVLVDRAAAQGGASGPAAPVAALNDGLLAVMRAGTGTPFAQRVATLRPIIDKSFALETILKASVGLRYGSLPADQQQQLLAAFGDYTVASYVANFDSFSGERFEITPGTRASGKDQIVASKIVPAGGAPTRLDYVMREGPGGWQIADVLVDGAISRVAVQRSDFRSLLSGGSAGPLISSLRAKTDRLASGGKS